MSAALVVPGPFVWPCAGGMTLAFGVVDGRPALAVGGVVLGLSGEECGTLGRALTPTGYVDDVGVTRTVTFSTTEDVDLRVTVHADGAAHLLAQDQHGTELEAVLSDAVRQACSTMLEATRFAAPESSPLGATHSGGELVDGAGEAFDGVSGESRESLGVVGRGSHGLGVVPGLAGVALGSGRAHGSSPSVAAGVLDTPRADDATVGDASGAAAALPPSAAAVSECPRCAANRAGVETSRVEIW